MGEYWGRKNILQNIRDICFWQMSFLFIGGFMVFRKNIIVLLIITTMILILSSCSGQDNNQLNESKLVPKEEIVTEEQAMLKNMALALDNNNFEEVKRIYKIFEEKYSDSEIKSNAKSIYRAALEYEENFNKKEKEKEEEIQKAKEYLNKLKINYDDVTDTNWYYQNYFEHYVNKNLVSILFAEKNDNIQIFLKLSYKGNAYIDFEKILLSHEGNTKEIEFNKENKYKDEKYNEFWEWVSVKIDDELLEFLVKLSMSDSSKIRFVGKYTEDRELTGIEKNGIIDVSNGYKALKILKQYSAIETYEIEKNTNSNEENEYIVSVNNQYILLEEYLNELRIKKEAYENQYGKDIWDTEMENGENYEVFLKKELLENMITNKALEIEAAKSGIGLSKEDFDKKFEEYKSQFDTEKAYLYFLESNKMTEEYIKRIIRRDEIINKYLNKYMDDLNIQSREIEEYYNNKNDFDKVRASHILVDDIELAQDIISKLNEGEDFAEMAKKYSIDGSASRGGDLGFFSKGEMIPEFEKVAFDLEEGQISEVFNTEFGYHIIKVTDKKSSFDENREEVEEEYKSKMLEDRIKEIRAEAEVEQLIDISAISITNLQ